MSVILVVEDEPLARKYLVRRLEAEGFDVISVETGAEAVDRARTSEVDIVLMDHSLPGVEDRSGVEIAEDIQQIRPHSSTIMVSAASPEEILANSAREPGSRIPLRLAGVVQKPIIDRFGDLKALLKSEVRNNAVRRVLRAMDRDIDFRDRLQQILTEESDLSPAVVAEALEELFQSKKLSAEVALECIHSALRCFRAEPIPEEGLQADLRPLVDLLRTVQGEGVGKSLGSVQILLVEDEAITRGRLAKLLERRGLTVVQAGTAEEALERAMNAHASVVLMDIQMGIGSEDGIDIGHRILMTHPYSSIIFVTAYGDELHYRQRTTDAELRVAAWFAKPIWDRLDQIVELIGKEVQKVKLRISLERALEQNISSSDRLREILEKDSSLSPESVDEIIDEVYTQGKVDIDNGIRLLYVALEHFVSRFSDEPTLRERTEPLLSRLKVLEEREADKFEEEFVARFRVKPGEISELYDWGRSLLKR